MSKTAVAWVNRCRFGDHGKILATVSPGDVITYETLAEASNKKYHELVGRNRYPPAIKTQPAPDDAPITMLAQMQQSITQGKVKNLKQSGLFKSNKESKKKPADESSSVKSSKTADSTVPGKNVKYDRKKFQDDKLPSDFPQEGKARVYHWPSYWKETEKDSKTFKYKGRKYKEWCRKCHDGKGQWMYHFTAKHDDWITRKCEWDGGTNCGRPTSGGSTKPTGKSTVANPSGNLALTFDESDSDDDGGAWTPVRF
jgi:hypothetical protein